MRRKSYFPVLVFAALLFIGLGDRVLPQPLNQYSRDTRTHVNKYLMGLFPYVDPLDSPHTRTEKAVENLEKGSSKEK